MVKRESERDTCTGALIFRFVSFRFCALVVVVIVVVVEAFCLVIATFVVVRLFCFCVYFFYLGFCRWRCDRRADFFFLLLNELLLYL